MWESLLSSVVPVVSMLYQKLCRGEGSWVIGPCSSVPRGPCWAGSSAQRCSCCWHLDPAVSSTCSAPPPPTLPASSAVHCSTFFPLHELLFILLSSWNVSVFPSGQLEGPRLLWYRNISSGISCSFPVRRRNMVVLRSERHLGLSTLPAQLLSYSLQVNYRSIISTFQL